MERADLEHWRAKEVARLFALLDTERRYYQEIVSGIPVGLMIVSSDMTIRSANRFFRQLFGFRSEQILRQRLETVPPVANLRNHVADVMATGTPQTNILLEFQSERGARVLRTAILPLRNWDDDAEEALIVIEQLTAAERAITPRAYPAISDALENMDAIAWEFDPATRRFVYVNARGAEWTGFGADVWLNSTEFWIERVHPGDRGWMARALGDLSAAGSSRTFEYRAATTGGGALRLRESIRVTRTANGAARRLYGVALRADGERAELERQFVAQRMDALARVSGKLSHDFNNALMVLSGYSEEVASALASEDPLRADMNEILRAAERLAAITQQLYSLGRRPALEATPRELNAFAGAVLPELEAAAGEKVRLVVSLAKEQLEVRMEPRELAQALVGLLRYIADERAPAASEVHLESGLGDPEDGDVVHAWIRLSDHGPALDGEARIRLFDPFDRSTSGPDALGLARIHGAIRAMHGDIRVTSGAEGTAFTILFAAIAQPAIAAPAAAPAAPEPEPAPEQTILLVEDEAGIRGLIHKILARHGYRVLEAGDADEARRLVREAGPRIDLLLTDVMLARKSGRELSETVREKYPGIRVLFISGFHEEPLPAGLGSVPQHVSYLQKPFTLGSLLLKVREMLAQH